MKHFSFIIIFLFFFLNLPAQTTINFEISFKNAVHHEAEIQAEFNDLKGDNLSVRMSRTSPGRYAIHDFAKNAYGLKAFDGKGNYSLGVKEQIMFPEINYDRIDKVRGMGISFVTTASTNEEGRDLLKMFGMPFKEK